MSTSRGKRLRRLSDEYPVPKSSSASVSPCSWSELRTVAGESASSISTDSVISSASVPARSPERSAIAATWAGKVGSITWRPETLTETPSSGSMSRCQAAVWRQACSRTCSPSSAIRPASSATGMNSSGEIRPRSGCSQRTSASVETGSAGGEVDHRLVPGLELAAVERAAQLGLGAHAGHGLRAHRLVEQLVAATAACLGPVHRRVGVAEQRLGRVLPGAGQGDAGADRERVLAAGEDQRAGDRGREPLRDLGRAAGAVDVGADHDELVAAEPRDRVASDAPRRSAAPRVRAAPRRRRRGRTRR